MSAVPKYSFAPAGNTGGPGDAVGPGVGAGLGVDGFAAFAKAR